jgi:hypothetical protein
MTANSVVSSIPKDWKSRLKSNQMKSNDTSIYFLLSTKKNASICKCKDINTYYVNELSHIPTACRTWCRLYDIDFDLTHWQFYFENIKHMTYRQHSRMIQFKIIHRILNVKSYLKKCKIIDSNSCETCGQDETISHVFYKCSRNENFILECKQWLDKLTKMNFRVTEMEYLFGILNENADDYINLYNRFFHCLKYYIWTCRTDNCKKTFDNFIIFIYL